MTAMNRIQALAAWVDADELPDEMMKSRSDGFREFYMPTEMVISKPGIYVPQVGRAWMVWQDDENSIEHIPNNVGEFNRPGSGKRLMSTSFFTRGQAWVVELFENYGDDGHTRYELVGYALIRSEDMDLFCNREGEQIGWIYTRHLYESERT